MQNKARRDFYEVNAPNTKVKVDNRIQNSKEKLWKTIVTGVIVALLGALFVYLVRNYLHIPL